MDNKVIRDFRARTSTPSALIKGVIGALFVLSLYEQRNKIRSAGLYLLKCVGLVAAQKKPLEQLTDQEPPKDKFEAATRFVATAEFSQSHQLQLYGLYKRVHEGVCTIEEPSRLYMEAHAKWQAWKSVAAESVEDAKGRYIVLVTLVHPEWATAPADAPAAARSKQKGLGPVTSTMAVETVESSEQDITYWAGEGDLEKVQACVDRGESVDQPFDEEGFTALMLAADRGHIELVQLLLTAKGSVNCVNVDGDTALHMASENDEVDVAKLLLANGADTQVENNEGEKPLPIWQ